MKKAKLICQIILIVAVFSTAFSPRPKGEKQQEPKIIELKLPVSDVDVVLSALAKLPYEQSAQLINKIVSQAQLQMQPIKKDTTKPAKKP